MVKNLPKTAEDTMLAHARAGRAALANGDVLSAEKAFLEAWNALPEPRLEYGYAQSLSRGLVEFFRDGGQPDKARQWLATTRLAYGGGEDSFVDFLAGTVAFAAGDFDEAFVFFDKLHKQYGDRPFKGFDGKYLSFYKRRARGH